MGAKVKWILNLKQNQLAYIIWPKNEHPLRFFVVSKNKVVNFKKQNLIGKLKNT